MIYLFCIIILLLGCKCFSVAGCLVCGLAGCCFAWYRHWVRSRSGHGTCGGDLEIVKVHVTCLIHFICWSLIMILIKISHPASCRAFLLISSRRRRKRCSAEVISWVKAFLKVTKAPTSGLLTPGFCYQTSYYMQWFCWENDGKIKPMFSHSRYISDHCLVDSVGIGQALGF